MPTVTRTASGSQTLLDTAAGTTAIDIFGIRRSSGRVAGFVGDPGLTAVLPCAKRAGPPPDADIDIVVRLCLDPRVVKRSYGLDEMLPGGETATIEFKSCMDRQGGDQGHFAISVVTGKVSRYLSAFLNSSGGAILFGVEDSGRVSGCALNERQRAACVKAIDSATQSLDPQVEVGAVSHWFAPVSAGSGGLFVLVVTAEQMPGQQPVYYLNRNSTDAWIRRAESVYPMDAGLIRQREAEFKSSGRDLARSWRHLVWRALPFEEHMDMARSDADMVPRPWVYERLADIIMGKEPPQGQLVLLVGPAGSGKTTLMSSLVKGGRSKRPEASGDWRNIAVVGHHFCMAGAPDTLQAADFVHNAAAAFCTSPYMTAFKQRAMCRAAEVLRVTELPDPAVAFSQLMRLCKNLQQPIRRLAFVVDGLDEAGSQPAPGQPTIASLICERAREAPPWLVFIVTSRSATPGILEAMTPGNVVDLASTMSEKDVSDLINARRATNRHLATGISDAAASQLASMSGANFQFARSVLETVAEQHWDRQRLQELLASPGSATHDSHQLEHLYVSLFKGQFDKSKFAKVVPVLELLLAAYRPLSHREIAGTLRVHYPELEVGAALRELKPYLTTSPGRRDEGCAAQGERSPRLSLQHLSFRQWLLDTSANPQHVCDLSRGHALMVSHHLSAVQSTGLSRWFGQRFSSSGKARGQFASSQRTFHILQAATHLAEMDRHAAIARDGAAARGVPSAARTLKELAGPALFEQDERGRSGIHFATKRANTREGLAALELLLEASRGTTPPPALTPARDGKSPLALGASRGQVQAVEALLHATGVAVAEGVATEVEAQAAVDVALKAAARGGHAEVVAKLLAAAAGRPLSETAAFLTKAEELVAQSLALRSPAHSPHSSPSLLQLKAPSPSPKLAPKTDDFCAAPDAAAMLPSPAVPLEEEGSDYVCSPPTSPLLTCRRSSGPKQAWQQKA